MTQIIIKTKVAIIGAGPAGLSAAYALNKNGIDDVLVLEREANSGGIPRHSNHPGYGIRDLKTNMSGPKYAKFLTDRAKKSGAKILTKTMVTHWISEKEFEATSPKGRMRIKADAIILATGARERPRSARMIAGDRSAGILTTGQLQNKVYIHGEKEIGKRAVIVGAELVSWSSVLTLSHVKCKTVELITEHKKPDSYFFFHLFGKAFFKTKVSTGIKVVRVFGKPRVCGVEVECLRTGARRIINCDTVIFTGNWISDNELARSLGIRISGKAKAPAADQSLATEIPGVFAAGNMLHPVDTADVAALDGFHVAKTVTSWLEKNEKSTYNSPTIQINATKGADWVFPNSYNSKAGHAARNRVLLWPNKLKYFPKIILKQNGVVIAKTKTLWPASPGRVYRVKSNILEKINKEHGDVSVEIH